MTRLQSGAPFPRQTVKTLDGKERVLGAFADGFDWQLIVIYRGLHCPICADYLGKLEEMKSQFHDNGIEVITASGDPERKAREFSENVGLSLPVGYDLSIEQMQEMGLYISDPRSPQETDRPFPEPGLFVVNSDGDLHIVDISNAPFARPDLERLASGLKFIRENDYPIRGTMVG